MKRIQKDIDQHIRRRTRGKEQIKQEDIHALQFPDEKQGRTRNVITGLTFDCQYFMKKRYSRQHTATSRSEALLTYDHVDTGIAGSGTYNPSNNTWTDGAKAWTINEWADHYLKVDDIYYLVLSNTATALTVDLEGKDDPDDSLAYSIVPFIPESLTGAFLVPDNSVQERRLEIIYNTQVSALVEPQTLLTGSVTTGDASAPYDTFIDSTKANKTKDDRWNNYTLKFTSGTNNGVSKKIIDYVDSSGTFITEAFSNSIDVVDEYEINDNLLWIAGTETFEVQGFVIPKSANFLDSTLAPFGTVFAKEVLTPSGEIVETNLPNYINAIYSIQFTAAKTVIASMDLDCQDSIRVLLKNNLSGDVQWLVNSGLKPNEVSMIKLNLEEGIQYRMDISVYMENGLKGWYFAVKEKSLGWYISSWESPLPDPPVWVEITGETSDPPAEFKQISLRWKNPANFYAE